MANKKITLLDGEAVDNRGMYLNVMNRLIDR